MSEHPIQLSSDQVARAILIIRGQKVMIDADLANLFGVKTSRLNEQVKRNINRFPPDFMFQLNAAEKKELIANCDHLEKLKFSRTNPYAFTEHGAIMLASVLNTPSAIHASVAIVRAFVKLREYALAHQELAHKMKELGSKYDYQFSLVFEALDRLNKQQELTQRHLIEGILPTEEGEEVRQIGFTTEDTKGNTKETED